MIGTALFLSGLVIGPIVALIVLRSAFGIHFTGDGLGRTQRIILVVGGKNATVGEEN